MANETNNKRKRAIAPIAIGMCLSLAVMGVGTAALASSYKEIDTDALMAKTLAEKAGEKVDVADTAKEAVDDAVKKQAEEAAKAEAEKKAAEEAAAKAEAEKKAAEEAKASESATKSNTEQKKSSDTSSSTENKKSSASNQSSTKSSAKSNSSSSSSSKSNSTSSSSSSKKSSNSSSTSSSSSSKSSSSKKAESAHTHSWEKVYTNKKVKVSDAYDEKVEAGTETVCTTCGKSIPSMAAWEKHSDATGHGAVTDKIKYKIVHHEAVYKTEKVLTGYKCSGCGATKGA